MRRRTSVGLALTAALVTTLAGCSGDTGDDAAKVDYSKAASVSDFGGMDGLVAAAKKEGELNVIALAPDWANWGELMDKFQSKYGIKINSANPDGSSQDEINAVTQLKGQDRAPDVLDLGQSFAAAAAKDDLLAAYKVATWADIPDSTKDKAGKWVSDYGGYMAIGCDSAKITTQPASFADLRKPDYKNAVAINGNPNEVGAAFAAVYAAALANGGTFSNMQPGVEYFKDLAGAGNFKPVAGAAATVQSGETPCMIHWEYLQATQIASKVPSYKIVIPSDATYAAYYTQAISASAPHPAAARLWEEFVYSDEGQNLFLRGATRPIRLDALVKNGTVDKDAYAKLPPAPAGEVKYPSETQQSAAKALLAQSWTSVTGS